MPELLPQLLVNSLITGSIYALASSGLAVTFGVLRILNFAHGHIMMAGAYAFFFFHVQQHLGVVAAAACSALFAAFLGAVTLVIFVRPFTTSSSLLPLITTIALGAILESIVSMTFGVNVRSFPLSFNDPSFEWRGIFITRIQILIIASALIILSTVGFYVHLTPVGRKIRAIAENELIAESLGISHRVITFGVFIISVLLAALAGILVGYETNIQPTMGGTYSIKAFAAMVLGGLGNIWGAVIGAFILGLVENLSIGLDFWGYSLPAGYKDAFAFVIILVVLLVRPRGLLGSLERST